MRRQSLDITNLRCAFPLLVQNPNLVYFDNAATTALDPVVLDTMMPYLTEKFGNPSSIYSYGRETKMAIEAARKSVANLIEKYLEHLDA